MHRRPTVGDVIDMQGGNMHVPIPRIRIAVLATAAVAGLGLAAGIAYATIPDSGVIHGCYQKNDGQLRVIDTQAGAGCRASEQPLDWNEAGAPGPAGPPGPQGPKGDPGATPSLSTYDVDSGYVGVSPGEELDVGVQCDPGDLSVGGGYILSSKTLQVRITSPDPHGWEVDVVNPSANSGFQFETIAHCLKVS
jgi:hypothetical protein